MNDSNTSIPPWMLKLKLKRQQQQQKKRSTQQKTSSTRQKTSSTEQKTSSTRQKTSSTQQKQKTSSTQQKSIPSTTSNKTRFSKNFRKNFQKDKKKLESFKTEQDIREEHPEFFDNLTQQILRTPVTPNFQGDLQKNKKDETIDIFSMMENSRGVYDPETKSLMCSDSAKRFPFTKIQITNQNLYKRNKELENQIKTYMNGNNIDPRLVERWKDLKIKNIKLQRHADKLQKQNGGFAPCDFIKMNSSNQTNKWLRRNTGWSL